MKKINSKATIIKKFGANEKDTGSTAVQIALVNEQIGKLSSHLIKNPNDNSSKRGLSILVSKRRSLLNYLKKHDLATYKSIIEKLEIRQSAN